MKKYLLFLFLISAFDVLSQEDDRIDLDILRAPESPAGILLDITNEQISRPSDPTGFMTLISQSTSNFTSLPDEFAVDIAPWLLFDAKNRTLEESWSNKVTNNFKNSFVTSIATRSLDSLELDNLFSVRQFSLGLKFSLFRGNQLDSTYLKNIKRLQAYAKKAEERIEQRRDELMLESVQLKSIDALIDSSRLKIIALQKKIETSLDSLNRNAMTFQREMEINNFRNLQEQRQLIEAHLTDIAQVFGNEGYETAKEIVQHLKLKRYGFKLDFAGGLVWDFPDNNFDEGSLRKAGVWFTGGWEFPSEFSFLLLARYLYNPDLNYLDGSDALKQGDASNFDLGGKLLISANDKKFSAGLEFIFRGYSEEDVEDGFRGTLNLSYDIGPNRQLGFALGRNFDGTISKDGNIIAAINLLLGFGSSRKI